MSVAPRVRLSVVLPVVLIAAVFIVAVTAATTWDPTFDTITFVFIAACVLWGAVQVAVGTLIAWRRPENRVGRLLQTSGVLVAAAFVGYFVAAIRMESAGSDDLVGGIAGWWASSSLYVAIYTAFPLLGLLFPDGRLPGPRWRLPTAIITVALVACCAVFAVAAGPLGTDLPDNPFGVVSLPPGAWDAASGIGALLLVAAIVLAVAAVVVRWRRGDPRERSQLKWLASAITVAGILFAVTFGGAEGESTSPMAVLGIGSSMLIPIAIGVAVFRYRLYEIDRIISRTIGWGIATALVAAVFVAGIIVLQAVLAGLTQGGTLAVAASTLVAFALFQPLRATVQRSVDRRFNRAGADAQRAVDAFGASTRDDVDLAALGSRLLGAADRAVQPRTIDLWIRRSAP